ncbi:MAG: YgiQ family radical SAM protein, partial [Eubacteriales bacterium]|nr:YgiQ family radical SAM protein [Eubacteriales bacterium]
MQLQGFLPVCRQDMQAQGIGQLDFVYICGDAYVDHPSFGAAIISRVLQSRGYTVGMLCQPDWRDPESVAALGEPRLGFLVSSGNMDSMVNHYTVNKKHRSRDAFTPGGVMGKRPDNAVVVYGNLIRRTFKKTPVILGGLEASLRRMSHYDYWQDKVRRSILLDAGADLISYGMGERSIVEIADALASGLDVRDITFIDGTVYKTREEEGIYDAVRLPDHEEVCVPTREGKRAYAESFALQHANTDPFQAKRLYEAYGGRTFVVQNPPAKPLTMQEMDDVYALPYMRTWHPMYDEAGGVPALGEIKFSLTSNRGCYGDCNFCALTFHEGRIVQARSHNSILDEAKQMLREPDFKGNIYDVGGPTAEFRAPACKKQLTHGACRHRRCLFPEPCPNLEVDHRDYLALLKKLRSLPGVKKVFIRSGFRFDYLLADRDRTFLRELCQHHISGQLRVAPEHVSDDVLARMGKPRSSVYREFVRLFEQTNQKTGKEQYIVPYLMSSHPGSTLKDAIALAEYIRELGYMPEQVQDFYPTPGTVSTCMYYTGLDPLSWEPAKTSGTERRPERDGEMEPVYVPRDPHEKAMQRALIQYRDPANYDLVKEALLRAGREDLIGFGEKCLIPPRRMEKAGRNHAGGKQKAGGNRAADRTGQKQKAISSLILTMPAVSRRFLPPGRSMRSSVSRREPCGSS